jgi:hypothetical protein
MQSFSLLAQLTLVLVALPSACAEQVAPSPTRAVFETAFFCAEILSSTSSFRMCC